MSAESHPQNPLEHRRGVAVAISLATKRPQVRNRNHKRGSSGKRFLFDVSYAEGHDFTLTPYLDTRNELTNMVRESEQVRIAEELLTKESAQLERYFD